MRYDKPDEILHQWAAELRAAGDQEQWNTLYDLAESVREIREARDVAAVAADAATARADEAEGGDDCEECRAKDVEIARLNRKADDAWAETCRYREQATAAMTKTSKQAHEIVQLRAKNERFADAVTAAVKAFRVEESA